MSRNSNAPKDFLYPLQTYADEFETGFCADGRQVVMGLLCPYLVAFFFDSQGVLLGKEKHLWEYPAPVHAKSGVYEIYDDAFVALMEEQITAFQEKIGFRAGTIHIKRFIYEEESVGIQPMPDEMVDFEEASYLDERQKEDIRQSRDYWLETGNFVWWWAKDYYIDSEGEVEST